MIKLCVFDLDGTLINTLEDLTDSVNYGLSKNGLPERTLDEVSHFVGNGINKLIQRASGIENNDLRFDKILDDFIENYRKHSACKTKPYKGITELLKELNERNILCAVLSNKDDRFILELVKEFFPSISFYHTQGKKEGVPEKPNPQSLNCIIDEAGLVKSECVFIGDSDVDVVTAHNAKIKCIGAIWGFRGKRELEQAGVDYFAKNPIDILKFI